jgi:CubicO group peptidase (beta-lactamase class C family)
MGSFAFGMMRHYSSAVAALALSTSAGAQDFSAARRLIRDWMEKASVPGLAVAVARGDSILWEEGFGWANREARVPATTHTAFYTASLSKAITATAAMLLRERGRLDLDRPANDYLAGSPLWSPAWDVRGATVRMLATHTAGLSSFDVGCAQQFPKCRMPSSNEIIRRYGVLVWPPGEHFDYSNLGYLILGEVVARAAGRDFGAFLREELFRPLGMMRSSFGVDEGLLQHTAVKYRVGVPLPQRNDLLSGGSTVYASAHDLLLFGAMHAKVRLRGMRPILSDAAIDTLHTTVPADSRGRYGFGWTVQDDRFGYRSLLAQGGDFASSAWLRIIPSEQIVVVVLVNISVSFPGEVIDAILSAMLPRYAELHAAQQVRATSGAPTPSSVALPAPLDSVLVGTWRGMIRAEHGDVPLEITVSDSGAIRAMLGRSSRVALRPARHSGAR